jgi:mannose-1-phosphate guanylyltransferase
MAGGIGSRFWPISRNAKPKQFLDILDTGKSFIRHTFERFAPLVPVENFLVVTNESYRQLVLDQIPELKNEQILGEPIGRNTAPCIAYATYKLLAADPEAEMIVTPADHLVLNEPEFDKVVEECVEFIRKNDALMTIGIKPNRPDTGYGYIQIEPDKKGTEIKKVKTFTEKPNLEMAKVFVESGEFFWNSGIFIWKAKVIRDALVTLLPDTAQLFASINGAYNTAIEKEHVDRVYPECKPISIDFGVMEKASNVYVRCSDFGWSDVGTWGSLYQNSEKDANGNVVSDNVITYNSKGCIIRTPDDTLAVVEGLEDYIVVRSGDVLMICPKANEQNVRRFIDDVKYSKGDKFI